MYFSHRAAHSTTAPNENERQRADRPVAAVDRDRKRAEKLLLFFSFFLLCEALCCCRFMFVICVVWFASYAVTSTCSRSCTSVAVSLSRKPTNWIHMCVRLAAAAVAQHNKTIHMHTQNDRFYSNSSSRVLLANDDDDGGDEEKSANTETD